MPLLKMATLILLALTFCQFANLSYAADGDDILKEKCLNCHSLAGSAAELDISSRAAVQWRRYFDKNKHNRFKDFRSILTEREIKILLEYLESHASDSEKPQVPGLYKLNN